MKQPKPKRTPPGRPPRGSRAPKRPHVTLKLGSDGTLQVSRWTKAPAWLREGLEGLRGISLGELARHRALWVYAAKMASLGHVEMLSSVRQAVEATFRRADREAVPFYSLRAHERLAELLNVTELKCLRSDLDRGFVAGETYECRASVINRIETDRRPERLSTGGIEMATITRTSQRLRIEIWRPRGQAYVFEEDRDDPDYVCRHFLVPHSSQPTETTPHRHERVLAALRTTEQHHGFELRTWQRDDVARLLTVGSGILGFEMGLGKTVCALALAAAAARSGSRDLALFIVPQDLVAQWQREAWKFFRRELKPIVDFRAATAAWFDRRLGRTIREPARSAREVAQAIRAGERGWFITYYEVLSRNGRELQELGPKFPVGLQTASELCPGCGRSEKWDQKRCGRCGYVHVRLKVKPAYAHLTTCFRGGTVVVDEGTIIKGAESNVSLSVRGIRAKHRIVLSGTPVKNYLGDAYQLLSWVAGPGSIRFPYPYNGGAEQFRAEFAVSERVVFKGEGGRGKHRGRTRQVPAVSNVYCLWRLLSGLIVRRTVDEIAEVVPYQFQPVRVPFGKRQRQQYEAWLDPKNFAAYFRRILPESHLKDSEIRGASASMGHLGQLWRLEMAATCPASETVHDYDPPDGASNWTPKLLKVLELVRQHVLQGDRVLVGSNLIATGPWIAEQLTRKGINALHIVEERNGSLITLGPKRRSSTIDEFTSGSAQVLCAGLQAASLGHNLECANVVIVAGLPWDLATFEQFLARVRRLTSKRPVMVYVVMVANSIDEKKWRLLREKSDAAALAIDRREVVHDEAPVNLTEFISELQDVGLPSKGPEFDERECEAAWNRGEVITESATRWVLPEETGRYRQIFEIAAALSSGYVVPLPDNIHRLGIVPAEDPRHRVYGLLRDDEVVTIEGRPVMGTAFDVAQRAVGWWQALDVLRQPTTYGSEALEPGSGWEGDLHAPGWVERARFQVGLFGGAAIRKALRLARMDDEDRRQTVRWWLTGDYRWTMQPEESLERYWVPEYRWVLEQAAAPPVR